MKVDRSFTLPKLRHTAQMLIGRGRSRRTQVTFDGRSYNVDFGVFDPEAHLSGTLFAQHLSSFRWDNQRILEVGTGCGLLAGVLADRGASVVATDVSDLAVKCAKKNLARTSVKVLGGDLFDAITDTRFDVIVTNPPYEVGRSRRTLYRSPDMLERLAVQWPTVARRLILAFPTDSVDILEAVGLELSLDARLPSAGRELGVFTASKPSRP